MINEDTIKVLVYSQKKEIALFHKLCALDFSANHMLVLNIVT